MSVPSRRPDKEVSMSHVQTADPQAVTPPGTELRRNALSARHIAVMSMAGTGPASVIALNLAFMGTFSGKALVFAFVLTLVVILLWTNTFVEFSRRIQSAGSLASWNSAGFGPSFGILYGWFFAGSYLVLSAAGFVVLGGWAEDYFTHHLINAGIPWWIYTLLGIGWTAVLAWLGVARSLHAALMLLAFELVVMIALGVWMVLSGGASGLDLSPFNPGNSGGGWAGIGLAMTYGILSMVGYEEAATLAEETRDSQRAVARGLWLAAVLIPTFYVLMSYAVVEGYGNITKFSGDAAALQTLADRYWGGGLGLGIVVIAVLSSILAFSQTAFNAGIRVVYVLGRERLLPGIFARTSPRYRTPTNAVVLFTLAVIAAGIPMGFITAPFDVWGYFGFMVSIAFLIVYLLTNIALISYLWRYEPQSFSIVRHVVLPICGVIGTGYPLYRVVHPLPPSPYVYLPWVVAAWAVLGLALVAYIRIVRTRDFERIGRVLGAPDVEEPALTAATDPTSGRVPA
jgi:amino acid transporter